MTNINVKNRQIYIGDNLTIMRHIKEPFADLVYLDPPFNSNANYETPGGGSFKDIWTWDDVSEQDLQDLGKKRTDLVAFISSVICDGTKAYLVMMALRLIEIHRLMKSTASVYLHCDPTASHYLKIVMDIVFGKNNYRNEVIWGYEKPRSAKNIWRKNHDSILFYTKSGNYTFKPQRVPLLDGSFELRQPFKRPNGSVWYPTEPGKQAGSWWYDIPSFATRVTARERTGYPTQKPLKLLERIINASSNGGG